MSDLQREAELAVGADLVAANSAAYSTLLERLWEKGFPPGSSTGWKSVDQHYTVAPGQLTIVTGWPGSGKSEWVDALLLNLARQGWRLAIHSPENRPEEIHVVKYLEKLLGKPFGDGLRERMSKDEVREAMDEISGWFGFLVAAAGSEKVVFGLEDILAAAELWFRSVGAWHSSEHPAGLVIDPWNQLEHYRPKDVSETDYVRMTLTMVRAWAAKHKVHVWIVAHPQKLRRGDDGKLPIPRPDSISGSQHWWNMADNCITVWREMGEMPAGWRQVDIHVQKVRFKHIGSQGLVQLEYDRPTGRYSEPLSAGLRVVA